MQGCRQALVKTQHLIHVGHFAAFRLGISILGQLEEHDDEELYN